MNDIKAVVLPKKCNFNRVKAAIVCFQWTYVKVAYYELIQVFMCICSVILNLKRLEYIDLLYLKQWHDFQHLLAEISFIDEYVPLLQKPYEWSKLCLMIHLKENYTYADEEDSFSPSTLIFPATKG